MEKKTADVRNEREKCERLWRENKDLREVRYWEGMEYEEKEKHRKVRKLKEDEKLERATRFRVRVEEDERERLRQLQYNSVPPQ